MSDLPASMRPTHDAETLLSALVSAAREGRSATDEPHTPELLADLVALTEVVPPQIPPPSELRFRDDWLARVEQSALAARAVAGVHDFDVLSNALERFLDAARASIGEAPKLFLHGRRAESASEDILPWSVIRERLHAEQLPTSPDDLLLQAWMDHRLGADHHQKLLQSVSSLEDWRLAYRRLIQNEADEIEVIRYEPKWSLDIAQNNSELGSAAILLSVPLPHAGDKTLEVRQHVDGTHWSFPWESGGTLVPFGQDHYQWGDEILGTSVTHIVVGDPSPIDDFWHGVACVSKELRREQSTSRVLEASCALSSTFVSGATADALDVAERNFESGTDPDADTIAWVACALRGRLVLEQAAGTLGEPTLYQNLIRADQACQGREAAVLLLPDDAYESAVGDTDVDEEEWWGVRARLGHRVPAVSLEEAFDELRSNKSSEERTVLASEPRETYALAAASSDEDSSALVGRVSVLAVQRDSGEAIPIEIRLARHAGVRGLFGDERMLLTARSAVLDAFRAAASLTPAGCPPYALEDHTLEIIEHSELRLESLDGGSLGLPIALGFLSVWLDQPLPRDLFATGRIAVGSDGPVVRSVGFVREKAAALARNATSRLRLLVPAEDSISAPAAENLTIIPVPRLLEAVSEAGLDPSSVTGAPSVVARAEELNRLAAHVEQQNITAYAQAAEAAGLTPWHFLAARMQLLIDSLERERPASAEHRSWAAVAFTHAGRFQEGARVLPNEPVSDPRGRTFQLLAELDTHIDHETWNEGREVASALVAALGTLPANAYDIRGKGLGTLGRFAMHQWDLTRGVPLLRRAVEEHVEHFAAESPRSRNYLAMALRMAGRFAEATTQLELARQELDEHAMPWFDRPYYDASLSYWHYELARLHVAMAQPDRALEHVTRALALVKARDPWPRVGILRTAAWAHRLRGDHSTADSLAQEISSWRNRLAQMAHLVDLLAEEARGMPRDRGTVY